MKPLAPPRTVEEIIDNDRNGWAVGAFHDPSSPFFSEDFEIKLWGPFDATRLRSEQPGSTNPDWFAHDHGGPEFLLVLEGEVAIDLGELEGDMIRCVRTHVLRAAETLVLPEGLYRRFRATNVRALTVRRAHPKR